MAHGHHHGEHAPGATHEAVPLDPENEIDARSATIWVVGGAIVTFLALWIMVPIFLRVLDEERMAKVNLAPNTELDATVKAESAFLAGDNPAKKDIRSVVDGLRK
jgi:beta-lactamase regulating signal transducer with metallopeptidase domain